MFVQVKARLETIIFHLPFNDFPFSYVSGGRLVNLYLESSAFLRSNSSSWYAESVKKVQKNILPFEKT